MSKPVVHIVPAFADKAPVVLVLASKKSMVSKYFYKSWPWDKRIRAWVVPYEDRAEILKLIDLSFRRKDSCFICADCSYGEPCEAWIESIESVFVVRDPDDLGEAQMQSDEPSMAPEEAAGIIGVSWPCTEEQLTAAYRQLAFQHHPDRGGSEETMAKINLARASLKKAAEAVETTIPL